MLCGVAILLFTCSKKSTNPDNGNPPDDHHPPYDTVLNISYTADSSRSVSQYMSEAAGGSITANDKDGVTFTLTIPPHALSANTTISITPFSFLRIAGPDTGGCAACTGDDSLCCYRGALFEPSGLILDSPAVLTVQLPSGMGFPFPHGALIVFLDSAGNGYEPCFTTYDTASGLLSAEITHFSGYGTDDERYDRLEEEIYQAGEQLSASVGTWEFYINLQPLKSLHLICNSCANPKLPLNSCFPDLVTEIEKIVLNCYSQHAAMVRGKAALQEPCDAMINLHMCITNMLSLFELGAWENAASFESIKSDLRTDLTSLVYAAGNEGHRLCEADSCEQGMPLLACASDAIRLSYVTGIAIDDQFCANVNNWMIACQCGIDVSIFADKNVAHKIAVSPGDAENCIVRYSAAVHSNVTNDPVSGIHVQFHALSGSVGTQFIGSGDTDEEGYCEIIFRGTEFDPDCPAGPTQRVFAVAADQSKAYYSDTVAVEIRGLKVAVTVDFRFEHRLESENIPGYVEVATGVINGTVTAPGRGVTQNPDCVEGNYTRTWTAELTDPRGGIASQGRMITGATVGASLAVCRADSSVVVPGTSVSVPLLSSVTVQMGFLEAWFGAEWSGVSYGNSFCDTLTGGYFDCGDRWYCTPVITPPVFIPSNGSFEPFRFSQDTLHNVVSQTVTVSPVF
jgi:hypothetical protein